MTALMALSTADTVTAVPAAPFSHQLRQADGSSFPARRWGDENLSGWDTDEGYAILFDDNLKSWVYAVHDKDEKLVSSGRQVGKQPPPGQLRKKLRPGKKATAGMPKKTMTTSLARSASLTTGPTTSPSASPATGVTGNIPVILVIFSDSPTPAYTAADFQTLLFGTGTWSMQDYYTEVSYGAFTVSPGPAGIIGWVSAASPHNYYGQNDPYGWDKWPGDLVYEAVTAADSTVNFAPYDLDGDCYVDVVDIIHQGTGEESSPDPKDIWSHSWSLSAAKTFGYSHNGVFTTNDTCLADPTQFVKINEYVIQPEKLGNGMTTMGVFAHEFGHALGLPDLYDTDYSSEGIGSWSLMAGGSWNAIDQGGDRPAHLDPWSRYVLGWSSPALIDASVTAQPFGAVESARDSYRLLDGGNEYFLLENRQKSGFDAGLPGEGLLVWHIDETMTDNNSAWYPGCTSCTGHYMVALVQADGLYSLEKNANSGDGGDPFPGTGNRQAFSRATTPGNNLYSGVSSGFRITGISPSGPTMTADITLIETTITSAPGALSNVTQATFTFCSPTLSATFECARDAGAWSACTSPATFSGLADGTHTFRVRAVDSDGTTDTTPAGHTWTIDTLPPVTSLGSTPDSLTASTSASFGFSADDPTAAYTCRLDAGAWSPCTSPATYGNLSPGAHIFSVYARDLAGNADLSPSTWDWVISTGSVKLAASGQTTAFLPTIAAAVSTFPAGTSPTIYLQSLTFAETIDVNRCGEQLTLTGGYNSDFTAVIGQTNVAGSLSVTCGTLIVEHLVVI